MQFAEGSSQANMRNKLAVKTENNSERNEFEIKCSSEQTSTASAITRKYHQNSSNFFYNII